MQFTRADLISALRKNGFGDSIAELEACSSDDERRAFFDRKGIEFENADAIKAWHNTKTVLIEATEGEDIQIVDAQEEPEGEEAMEGDEEREAPEPQRSSRRRENRSAYVKTTAGQAKAPAVRSYREKRRKAYELASQRGETFGSRGKMPGRPIWSSADQAEAFGAIARLKSCARLAEGYPQKSADLDIMQKFLGTTDLTEGGAFIAEEFDASIIENFPSFGVARRVAGVEAMRGDTKIVPRHTDDVDVSLATEGTSATESNPKQDMVQLVAQKALGRSRASSEILNDAAIDIADYIARSHRRAIDRFVDQAYLLGQHGFEGVIDFQDADNTFDAALSSGWLDATIDDLQSVKSRLPAWALEDTTDLAYVCHPSFAAETFERFELNNGGLDRAGLREGPPADMRFNGLPVIFSAVMPSSYTADEHPLYLGAFRRGTKYGEVTGSFEIQASDQEEFSNDIIVFRSRLRFAVNIHDMGIDRDDDGDGTAENQDAVAFFQA